VESINYASLCGLVVRHWMRIQVINLIAFRYYTKGYYTNSIEYCENFKKYDVDSKIKGKSAAPILVPLSGGQFVAKTESKEQFVKHQLPKTVSAKKAEVILQGGSFESDTTQKLDYQVWPITKAPHRYNPQVAITSSGAFDGTTTNKRDYLAFQLPPKFKAKTAEYIRSDAKTLKESVQAEDYKPWKITVIPQRRTGAAPHISANDDRYLFFIKD
jgi:hypothetical protein